MEEGERDGEGERERGGGGERERERERVSEGERERETLRMSGWGERGRENLRGRFLLRFLTALEFLVLILPRML